jgi:hypothetical protein
LNGIGQIAGENRIYAGKSGINSDVEWECDRVPRGVKAGDCKHGQKFYRINAVAEQVYDAGGVKQSASLCYQGTMIRKQFVKKVKTIITGRVSFAEKDNLQKYARNMKYSYYTLSPVRWILIRLKNIGEHEKGIMRYRPITRIIETAVHACLG